MAYDSGPWPQQQQQQLVVAAAAVAAVAFGLDAVLAVHVAAELAAAVGD